MTPAVGKGISSGARVGQAQRDDTVERDRGRWGFMVKTWDEFDAAERTTLSGISRRYVVVRLV